MTDLPVASLPGAAPARFVNIPGNAKLPSDNPPIRKHSRRPKRVFVVVSFRMTGQKFKGKKI